jgi:aryl-alcohol dehydrogenase-like predicted oxidoreductase
MRYKLLGKSGLRVSELCLGTMTFGEDWGWGSSKEVSKKIFESFAEAGGNFIDTANGYTNGTSEKMLGEFIKTDREKFVLATKYSFNQKPGDPNAGGNHRKNLIQSLDASLKRLNVDYVDLYWVHAWDDLTPVEEVMRALDDVVKQGKVLYAGVSDTPAWVISQGNTIAQYRGWTEFTALQIEYSLVERTPERDLLPMAQHFEMAVTPWSPLGGGVLTGKYNQKSAGENGKRLESVFTHKKSERNLQIAQAVTEVAKQLGVSNAQVALAWLRHQPGAIIPILGARTFEQWQDNLACLNVNLSESELKKLNEVSAIDLGFPHDFLSSEMIRDRLHGGTFNNVDRHRTTVTQYLR